MKKTLIILLFLLFPLPAFAQDYWVYVRLEDRVSLTDDDTAGRSKAGDIIAIVKDTPNYQPSEEEKKQYLIFKTADISPDEKTNLLKPGVTKNGVKGQYRENKLKVDEIGVVVKKGAVDTLIDKELLKTKSAPKTAKDLIAYKVKTRVYASLGYPLERLARIIISPAYAVTVSTINKSGNTYNTLSLWEDAVDGILIDIQEADCYNDTNAELDDVVVIDGSVTTALTAYMYITAPVGERHLGTAGGGFVLNPATTAINNGLGVISPLDNYTVVEWVEIKNWFGAFNSTGWGISNAGQGITNCLIRNNLIHDSNNANFSSTGGINNEGTGSYVTNNIIYNVEGPGIQNGVGECYTQNNTVYNYNTSNNSRAGIEVGYSSSGTPICENNLVIAGSNGGSTYALDSTFTVDYNGTSESSLAQGTHNKANLTTSEFVSTTNLHIVTGATSKDAGTDLGSTNNENIDINAYTRTGTWDMGAHEFVAAGGDTSSVIDFF